MPKPILLFLLLLWPVSVGLHPVAAPGVRDDRFPGAPIELADRTTLEKLFQALDAAKARKRRVRIVQYGDSHTAADIVTAEIRERLRKDFGNGGIGFVVPGFPYPWFSRRGAKSSGSGGWTPVGIGKNWEAGDRRCGPAGVSVETEAANEWLRLEAPGERFEVHLLEQPGGGTVEIRLDGEPVTEQLTLDNPKFEPVSLVFATKPKTETHFLDLRVIGPGKVRIFGFSAENRSGAVVDTFGINGARAYRPLSWNETSLSAGLRELSPDLVILAYGTNEVTDPDLFPDYETRFTQLVRRFKKAAPKAVILVLGPPDRMQKSGNQWIPIPALPQLVATQRRVASAEGALFWDQAAALGGFGTMDRLARLPVPMAQADRIHLTKPGYQKLGELLFEALMKARPGTSTPEAGNSPSR